mgnify:CR=1 FL=1
MLRFTRARHEFSTSNIGTQPQGPCQKTTNKIQWFFIVGVSEELVWVEIQWIWDVRYVNQQNILLSAAARSMDRSIDMAPLVQPHHPNFQFRHLFRVVWCRWWPRAWAWAWTPCARSVWSSSHPPTPSQSVLFWLG